MIKLYKCEIITQCDFNRIGEIKSFFIYDYERLKDNLRLIEIKEVLK